MKRKSLLALLLALIAGCSVLAACRDTKSDVELVGFTDETITVELGSTYTIPAQSVLDTAGNEYRLSVTVKTASGAEILPDANQFKIERMEGYVLTYSATVAEGDVRTRKVTLVVEDKGDPVLTIAPAVRGFVDEPYELPAVTVRDASGEELTASVKVYLVEGDKKTEQTVTGNTFTPATRGEYVVEATATDSAGNTGKASAGFFVRAAMADYVLEDFNDAYGLSTFTNKANGMTEEAEKWHETFEGRAGVASGKSTANEYGPHEYFKFDMTTEQLAALEFYHISIRAYIACSDESVKTVPVNNWNVKLGDYKVNEWVEIRLDAQLIASSQSRYADPKIRQEGETPRECFNRVMTTGTGEYLFWIGKTPADAFTVYVDEIGYKPFIRPELTCPTEYDLGDEVTLTAKASITEYTVEYTVTDPLGRPVELDGAKFRAAVTGQYRVRATLKHAEHTGYADYTLTAVSDKTVEIAAYTGSPKQGDTVTIPDGTFAGATVESFVTLYGNEVALDGKTFTAKVAGEYVVTYVAVKDGLTYVNTTVIVVAAADTRPAAAPDEVEGFDHPDSVDSFQTFNGTTTVEWLAGYEGETGVIKYTYSGTEWPAFTFAQRQAMSAYADYDFLVIRAFVVDNTGAYNGLHLVNADDAADVVYKWDLVKGEWHDYVYDIKGFLKFWKDEGTDTVAARVWSGQVSGAEGTIYVADIRVAKDIADTGLSVSMTGEPVEGQTVTLTVTNPNSAEYTLSVSDPAGKAVTVNKNGNAYTFTAAVGGAYQVKITSPGCGNAVEYTAQVKNAAEVEIDAYAGEPAVGDTITVPGARLKNLLTGETIGDAVKTFTVKLAYFGELEELTATGFTAAYAGTYTVTYSFAYNGSTYSDSTKIVVPRADPAPNGVRAEAESFDQPASGGNFTAFNGTVTLDWLASYKGETGVIKYSYKGTEWPAFTFTQRQAMSVYADYDYLVIRAYVADDPGAYTFLKLGANTGKDVFPLEIGSNVRKGEWYDYVYPIATFLENWKDSGTDTGKARVWSGLVAGGPAGNMYLSDIYAIKGAGKAGVTVSVTGEKKEGQELTVTAQIPEGVEAKMTVIGPDGKTVVLTGGKLTAAAGTYTIRVTAAGYYGAAEQTFEVAPAVDFRLKGSFADNLKAGDSVTVPDMELYHTIREEVLVEKLTYTVSYYGMDVAVAGGAFTAAGGGDYVVTYTTEYDGADWTKQVTVTVARAAAADTEVESFDVAGALDNVGMKYAAGKSYVADAPANAAHGSVRFELEQRSGDSWPILWINPRQTRDAYASYNTVRLTVKLVASEAGSADLWFWDNDEKATVKFNEWTTVDVDAWRMIEKWSTLGNEGGEKGWFWFTNAGGNTVQALLIHDVSVVADAAGKDYLAKFDTQEAIAAVTTEESSDVSFVAAATETLPAPDTGDAGYAAVVNKTGAQWFNVRVKPDCAFEEFVQADWLGVKLYVTGAGNLNFFYFNYKIATVERGKWVTVKMPIAVLKTTEHASFAFRSRRQMFDALSANKLFMLSGSTDQYTVCVASVSLGKDTPDAALGDKYAALSENTVRVSSGTVTAETFDGKSCVKIVSSDTWANVFIQPGKTYRELLGYSKVRVKLYVEGGEAVPFYTQAKLYGSGTNDFVPYGAQEPGKWADMEIDMTRVLELYGGFSLDANAFMIDQGKAFTALYIAEVVCVR